MLRISGMTTGLISRVTTGLISRVIFGMAYELSSLRTTDCQ